MVDRIVNTLDRIGELQHRVDYDWVADAAIAPQRPQASHPERVRSVILSEGWASS